MILPSMLAIIIPIVTGLVLVWQALSLLAGGLAGGFVLAILWLTWRRLG